MSGFWPTEEQEAIREGVRQVAAAYGDEYWREPDATGVFPEAFVADMAAIFGGLVVSWIYAGLSPEAFLNRLQLAISFNTFMVGMIKAPFMALVISLIGTLEGLKVQGSSESLGRQVTSSVVKGIFMVIVVDGLFAMFFAAIRY